MEEKKVRRTKEQIVAEYDKKIETHKAAIAQAKEAYEAKAAYHQGHINKFEAKKEATLNPKPRAKVVRKTANSLIKQAKEKGMTIEEIAEKLGLSE